MSPAQNGALKVFRPTRSGTVCARPPLARPTYMMPRAGRAVGGTRAAQSSGSLGCDGCTGMRQDDVGGERDQFRRVFAHVVSVAAAPAGVDPHVAAVGPA